MTVRRLQPNWRHSRSERSGKPVAVQAGNLGIGPTFPAITNMGWARVPINEPSVQVQQTRLWLLR
jgi:hypothetical protein